MTRTLFALGAAAWLAAAPAAAGAAGGLPRLVGTLLDGSRAVAVFEGPGGRQVVAQVGQPVAPGLRLAAVGRGRVEVERADGRRVTMRTTGATGGAGAAPAAPPGAPAASEPAAPGRLAGVVCDDAETPPNPEAPRPPRAQPACLRWDGAASRWQLTAGPPDSPLVRAGFAPGDVVDPDDPRLPPEVAAAIRAGAPDGRP
jgi:hypothetical protein